MKGVSCETSKARSLLVTIIFPLLLYTNFFVAFSWCTNGYKVTNWLKVGLSYPVKKSLRIRQISPSSYLVSLAGRNNNLRYSNVLKTITPCAR